MSASTAVSDVAKQSQASARPNPCPDLDSEFVAMFERCKPLTMTSIERMYALHQATKYVNARGIEGAFVECGVWRGGSAMIAALTLRQIGDDSREFFLYDTYEGMTEPTDKDVDFKNQPALDKWDPRQKKIVSKWLDPSIQDTRDNLASTGYPGEKLHFIQGRVEDTIPWQSPAKIALLRLDTDWFDSTWHELIHLYPRLAPGGVLIIDDYGHWQGCRQAVDQYCAENNIHLLLNRIDYTGRMAIKI